VKPAAVVCDLYGTLLDIATLRDRVAAAGIARADAFVATWRAKQIAYSWCAALMNEYCDFDVLTKRALDFALAAYDAPLAPADAADLAAAWLDLPPYPDAAAALASLRSRGIALAVLTNGVRASAERALRAGGMRELVDDLLSVESVRTYKPHPSVYALVTERYACEPERIVFVSSNGWDATGAAAFGFRVAWCNRTNETPETLGFPPWVTVSGLSELAERVR
jgi:2-haloacid dehalogenase